MERRKSKLVKPETYIISKQTQTTNSSKNQENPLAHSKKKQLPGRQNSNGPLSKNPFRFLSSLGTIIPGMTQAYVVRISSGPLNGFEGWQAISPGSRITKGDICFSNSSQGQ